MIEIPKSIENALPESIGNPDLFTGRKREFSWFLGKWFEYLKTDGAMSHAIVARRKKGKTAFVQRLFNILWSLHDPQVIPFYFCMPEVETPLPDLARDFVRNLVGQIVAFETQDASLISSPPSFEKLPSITDNPCYLKYYEALKDDEASGRWLSMWKTAAAAPSEIAITGRVKIVQIIDEFQYINRFITDGTGKPIETLSGSYLQLAEIRQAPLIVSGSEVNWLLSIIRSLVGRFSEWRLENFPEDEARESIETYARYTRTKVCTESVERIWNLTRGDPLYIRQLFMSRFNEAGDFTLPENIVHVYEKEIAPGGGIFGTWWEYLGKIFDDVNKMNAKRIVMYLFNKGERTKKEIVDDLKLADSDTEITLKLQALSGADVIGQGRSPFHFSVGSDKTYELVFRNLFQHEIENFEPDIPERIRREMGIQNERKGLFGEFEVRHRLKRGFNLKDIAYGGPDLEFHPRGIEERVPVKLGFDSYEIDLIVQGNPEIWIEVKYRDTPFGKHELKRVEKLVRALDTLDVRPLFMVFSKSGFTKDVADRLDALGILRSDSSLLR